MRRFAEGVPFTLTVQLGAEHVRFTMRKGQAAIVRSGRRRVEPVIVRPKGPLFQKGYAVWMLWAFFSEPEAKRRRLKVCRTCEDWFVDYTRPGNSAACSKACTWRYWNRQRRREAAERRKGR